MNLGFGTDPEVFVTANGKIISPSLLEKFSGIKPVIDDLKHPIYINTGEFSWMQDGAAFELTVKKILKNGKDFRKVFDNSLESLQEYIKNLQFNGFNLDLVVKPSAPIDPDMYLEFITEDSKTYDEKVYQGFIYGCDEDYDAVDSNYICTTTNALKDLFRYGGGHFHVSGVSEFEIYPKPAIVFMAILLGNYFVLNAEDKELNKKRVEVYGRPFRYRPTKYSNGDVGIEYRSLSNSIMKFTVSQFEEMIYLSHLATEFLLKKRGDIYKNYLKLTDKAMNTYDRSLSAHILNEIGVLA